MLSLSLCAVICLNKSLYSRKLKRQKTALPLLGVIIPRLPLFSIPYHTCGRTSKKDPNATVSDSNATISLVGFAPPPGALGQ